MKKLEFLSTVSAAEFKAEKGVSKLDIFLNETSGKCFFKFGAKTGAVTSKYLDEDEPLDKPVISEVMDEEGNKFYLLHNESTSNVTKMASI